MAIRDLCNRRIVTVYSGTDVLKAAQLMKSQHVGDVLVLEKSADKKQNKVIGILTDRDVVKMVVANGISPANVLVDDIMSRSLQVVNESLGVYEVIRSMHEAGVRRMPVVSADGSVLGLVTFDDLVSLLAQELVKLTEIIDRQIREEERTTFHLSVS